ncbi:MAG: GTPase ObgE [Anaerolineaceae bacterium]|nr:GTPase ObgE [Anaerolineaceae bacterium]
MHDEAKIYVRSGAGGDGIIAFHREKRVPKGGPSGGDGGKGGDVFLRVNPKIHTLRKFERQSHFIAKDGGRGGPRRKTGASAEPLYIDVPPGTWIQTDQGRALADLVTAGDSFCVAQGGRGGKGNIRFVNARRRSPRIAEKGEPGEALWLKLELRILADVGIVGLPNAGKSTLLSALSKARPTIADYPFTTLEPNLGVVYLGDQELVVADIPGLLEGAHLGVGLGHNFLRHLLRTRLLIHLIDGNAPNPVADFQLISAELALYSEELESKPRIIVLNKMDLRKDKNDWRQWEEQFVAAGHPILKISALNRQGIDALTQQLFFAYGELPAAEDQRRTVIPEAMECERQPKYTILRDSAGRYIVRGERIERAASMTYWEYEESVHRFQKILAGLGISAALIQSGVQVGDTVLIGDRELEWSE